MGRILQMDAPLSQLARLVADVTKVDMAKSRHLVHKYSEIVKMELKHLDTAMTYEDLRLDFEMFYKDTDQYQELIQEAHTEAEAQQMVWEEYLEVAAKVGDITAAQERAWK